MESGTTVEKFVLAVGERRKVGRWDVVRVNGVLSATDSLLTGREMVALRGLSTLRVGMALTPPEDRLAHELKCTGIHPCSGFSITLDPSTFFVTINQAWNHTQMMCWELSEWAQTSARKERLNIFDAGRKKALWRGLSNRRMPGLRRSRHRLGRENSACSFKDKMVKRMKEWNSQFVCCCPRMPGRAMPYDKNGKCKKCGGKLV